MLEQLERRMSSRPIPHVSASYETEESQKRQQDGVCRTARPKAHAADVELKVAVGGRVKVVEQLERRMSSRSARFPIQYVRELRD